MGMKLRSDTSSRLAKAANSSRIAPEDVGVVSDQVHLVHAEEKVGNPEQRGQKGVAPGLLDDALPRVDQHQRQVGVRVPGDHVAGVLDVTGGVGDDELAGRGGEVPVGDIDRDALFALGSQPIGQQCQVGVLVPPLAADPFNRFELVLEDGLGVVEEATDQRALAVVHRTGRGDAQELHQK